MEDNHLYFQTMKCLPLYQLDALPSLAFNSDQSEAVIQEKRISEANQYESQPVYSILELNK